MRLLVDIDRFPRPQRSGLLSVIAMYVIICSACAIWDAPFMVDGPLTIETVVCWVMPWGCLANRHRPVAHVKPPDEYVTALVYVPPSVDPKKHTSCYLLTYKEGYYGFHIDCDLCPRANLMLTHLPCGHDKVPNVIAGTVEYDSVHGWQFLVDFYDKTWGEVRNVQ